MTRIEKLFSRRDAQEISFCWSPFPEEKLDGNVIHEDEVAFFHGETRSCRADASKYTGEIAIANIY